MSKRWPNKTIIGLTGNIATGKSAVMRFAAERGALTIDADHVVHGVLDNNIAVQKNILKVFGDEVKGADGRINRQALGAVVFRDPESLKKLENLVHPAVRQVIEAEIEDTEAEVIVIEAIKLLEGDLAEQCDAVWVTNCGKLLQMQRLVYARGMGEDEAFARVAAQNPQADKLARADVVIDTKGTLAQTRAQVAAAWETLTVLRAEPEETAAEPLAVDVPAAEPAAPTAEAAASAEGIVVRRARPSDIPSIMLLIHKATDGKVKPKRAEILMSLSDRGYLIGQAEDGDISTVIGWYADKGFAGIEQCYMHPAEAAETTGKAVLQEINKSANDLMCEAIYAFINEDTPQMVVELLTKLGYEKASAADVARWPRAWKEALEEMQPADSTLLAKKLWNARVA